MRGLLASFLLSLLLVRFSSAIAHWPSVQLKVNSRSTEVDSSVPHVIHQSWKNMDVPIHYKEWQQSWVKLNPGWRYVLWTDEANRALVERYYKWLLPTYDSFPKPILKADFARYLYMHHFGGIYADLDFQALRPMKDLFKAFPGRAYVGNISTDESFEHNTPNAWMASEKGHPFWLFAIGEIIRRSEEARVKQSYTAEEVTGPMMLQKALQLYNHYLRGKEDAVTILPPKIVYPLDWRHVDPPCTWDDIKAAKFSASTPCAKLHNESFALTYWLHGWDKR